ncbi:MAG: HAD family hydrolase [Candidatus Eremiobacteraeota bacterium]|nr:HAD family hydrolase [Candidatus Eremiobacteraeota bacterium]
MPVQLAIGFDFDHTLGIDNKLERVAFLRLLEQLIFAGGKAIGTLDEETAHIDDLLAQQRSGAFPIDEAVERFCKPRLPHTDVHPYIQAYKKFALESVDYFVVPLPGVRALLQELRRSGVRTAILTNGWSPLQERKAARVGFEGPVVVSERVGVQKPEKTAFAALVAALGVPLSDAWYVGDNPATDVAGSIAAGLRGIWLDAELVTYPSDLPKPNVVIHSLNELVDLLPGATTPA